MGEAATRLLQQALTLPQEDRAKLAASLIESLDEDADAEIEIAWRHEIDRRIREIDEKSVELIDWEDLRRSLQR